ncbi:unnamed protein product [Paramecium pentaurelia]|uniref:non-specific serine/threonine protein kinase n=1 Tax=Paramecium pentaurelia TaxID=43138 RepID=A0A8S1V9C7_9CILI|nr:unnamed protein product [Paramecium pentaurelia]
MQSNSIIDAPIQNFPNRKFERIKVLGQGGEGTVYLCKSKNWGINDQKQFALKFQYQSKGDEIQFIDNLIAYQNQYENLINQGKSNYQSSGLIRIYERFQLNNQDFIIMEAGEIDLYDYIKQQQNLSFDQKIKILIQITQSIQYLHQNNLIHRDIKPENFIKVADQFKLIDFGLTKQNSFIFKTTGVGTLLFQAPEVLENKANYDFSIDIWSLACVFYEILSGQALFNGENQNQVVQMILGCKLNSNFLNERLNKGNIDDTLKDLLKQMLKYNSAERIKLQKVLSILVDYSNSKSNNQQQQFNIQSKFPIQQDNKILTPQNFQQFGNSNLQQNIITQQIQQLQEQITDFNCQQTKNQKNIENLLMQLVNQKDQIQDKIQNLEHKIDDFTSQIKKKESGDQDQYNSLQIQIQNYENQLKVKINLEQENFILIKDQQNKILNLELILSEIEKKHDMKIIQYKNKVSELEAKLQEQISKDEQLISVQTKNQALKQDEGQDQEYQILNSIKDNSFQQTFEQQDNTSQLEHQQNGVELKLNGEQKECQLQNNQDVNKNQFEQIKQQIQDILSKMQVIDSDKMRQQNKKNLNKYQGIIADQMEDLKNKLFKTILQIINTYGKGKNQLNDLKALFFDKKKINFPKLNEIIQQIYQEIQTQQSKQNQQNLNQITEIKQETKIKQEPAKQQNQNLTKRKK